MSTLHCHEPPTSTSFLDNKDIKQTGKGDQFEICQRAAYLLKLRVVEDWDVDPKKDQENIGNQGNL